MLQKATSSSSENVKKYVNTFLAESGLYILQLIDKYKVDDDKKTSMLTNVFQDEDVKKSLEKSLKKLLGEHNLNAEYEQVLWYGFVSNSNPDFEILLQRFMFFVPVHANSHKDKIDRDKWRKLEDPNERDEHEKHRLGIYALYQSGKVPRHINRVSLVNGNPNIGCSIECSWMQKLNLDEDIGTFYLWQSDEKKCKDALFTAKNVIVDQIDQEKFYNYMKFIWNGLDTGSDAMLLYTAKPIAYAPGGIPESSIGEVYLAEYKRPLSKTARNIIMQFLEELALILHARFAREDMIELGQTKPYKAMIEFAIKSAIAAIMSRNMSHNLGSHLLTNTKNYISKRAESENDADLRGIVHLLQYIQERMDFIATIVSGDIYPLAALNVKSQFFDELTIDDKVKRHSGEKASDKKRANNFLLEYLVSSEKYTHYHTFKDEHKLPLDNCKELLLQIEYPDWNHLEESEPKIYTGLESRKDKEEGIRLALSKLNLAVPQGIMARHAFFSIIENIIRNAAKHAKGNNSDLKITIRFSIDQTNKSKVKISIYDNKGNAEEETDTKDNNGMSMQVVQLLNNKLSNLKIINQNNEMDRNDKGLKEILISVLWLKQINIATFFLNFKVNKSKLDDVLKIGKEKNNLMYEFSLPIFETATNYEKNNKLESYHVDVIVEREGANSTEKMQCQKNFTRFFDGDKNVYDTQEKRLKFCIEKNLFGLDTNKQPKSNIDNYKICIETTAYKLSDYSKECQCQLTEKEIDNEKFIILKNHFHKETHDNQLHLLKSLPNVPYVDSISGENFTSTIIKPDFLNETILRYKVIESALTKIAIIDERIYFKFYEKDDDLPELAMNKKGIYIYTVEFDGEDPEIKNLIEENIYIEEPIKVHFLTIHLALLEKWKTKTKQEISEIIQYLENKFGCKNRIIIHSGRGDFSEDISNDLKNYPFITLSGIEAVLYDSKYQLSQLFYNTIYYGKGNFN